MTPSPSHRNLDPIGVEARYRQGIVYLQSGEWTLAIEALEEVALARPDDPAVAELLRQARFKASLDAGVKVKARQSTFPWRRVATIALLVVLLAGLGVAGEWTWRTRLAPVLAQAAEERAVSDLEREGLACLQAQVPDLDCAHDRYTRLLEKRPNHPDAPAALAEVDRQRGLRALYVSAVTLQDVGDLEGALALYTDISMQASNYLDVSARVQAIRRATELDRLLADAEADISAGRLREAAETFETIRARSSAYRADYVGARLVELYEALGRDIVDRQPPDTTALAQAQEYFTRALSVQPRNAVISLERQLVSLFVEGQTRYYEGRWDEAATRLLAVYDRRPGYLAPVLPNMLYDALVRSGEGHERREDIYAAYDQYRRAALLPVDDTSLAEGRMGALQPRITPSPVPSITATPTATPLPAPTRRPVAGAGAPSAPAAATTPRPMAAYRGRIVFYSDNPQQPGLYVMDADGGNRTYIGRSADLDRQYRELVESERLSPDGRYRLYNQNDGQGIAQLMIARPDGGATQLTDLGGVNYDPVWAPDGSRVAFVSQTDESDDIWLIHASGGVATNLTPQRASFEKRPSWSPDSARIAFWSDRDGPKQIYVMDANSSNVRRITNTGWDEYDPVWVK